jgi:predicted RNA-binding protein with PIN domain
MRYVIDGYNLLHAMGLLSGKAGPHGLEKARRALLGHLCGNHQAEVANVTVVFDAARAPAGAVPEDTYQGIHICYALDGEADELIEDLIQHDATPRQLTVVSDDHRIQHAGRRRRCPVLGCMDYLDTMERLRQPKAATEESAKPERLTEDETRHWLRAFGDLADDPMTREALGPDFREEKDP